MQVPRLINTHMKFCRVFRFGFFFALLRWESPKSVPFGWCICCFCWGSTGFGLQGGRVGKHWRSSSVCCADGFEAQHQIGWSAGKYIQCLILVTGTKTSTSVLSLGILFLKQSCVNSWEAAVTGGWKVMLVFGALGTQCWEREEPVWALGWFAHPL